MGPAALTSRPLNEGERRVIGHNARVSLSWRMWLPRLHAVYKEMRVIGWREIPGVLGKMPTLGFTTPG